MNETAKLSEAEYFYSRMILEINNREAFLHNLSAFLSSARSVLQYALKEAEPKTDGKKWYDGKMADSEVLKFFKDKRNINIHTEPVKARQHTTVELTSTIHISSSISFKHYDAQGNLKSEYMEEPKPLPKPPESTIKISNRFTFPDWAGTEDIPALCQKYLAELKSFIQDGLEKKWIS